MINFRKKDKKKHDFFRKSCIYLLFSIINNFTVMYENVGADGILHSCNTIQRIRRRSVLKN